MADAATNGPRILGGVPGTRFDRVEWYSDIGSTNSYAMASSREVLLASWLERCERWLRMLEHDDAGPALLRWAHRARSATIGTRVRVERPDDVIVGTAVDVTVAGQLVVQRDAPAAERVEV